MKYTEPISKILLADKAQISAANFKPLINENRFTSSCFKIFAMKFGPFISLLFLKRVLSSILALLVISLGIGIATASAQNYTPLVPLPGTIAQGGSTTNLSVYLAGMIKLLIALGGALAVLFAIIGGTQYVAASINPSAKSAALEKVWGALIGLAIILSSYLLLNSINPKLVQFNLALEPVTPKALEKFSYSVPEPWGNDNAERVYLSRGTGISVKTPSCSRVGETGCTSVYKLSPEASDGLRRFYTKCTEETRGYLMGDCVIVVTGGTEYWLHLTHNDKRKVDLRKGDGAGVVDRYIKSKGTIPETPCGLRNAPKYQPDGPSGGTYVDEGDHWHVCY